MQRLSYILQNNDFNFEEKECSVTPKKFEDEELGALFHKDSYQMLVELAKSLGVS